MKMTSLRKLEKCLRRNKRESIISLNEGVKVRVEMAGKWIARCG